MTKEPAAVSAEPIFRAPPQAVATAFTTVVVGFASTILLVVEAARVVGATPEQSASWVAALCFGMATATFILSLRYRMPIITAWSTPGAVVIATSTAGIAYPEALGAFVFAGILMCLTAAFTPLSRLIGRIPPAIAAAMLTGVLLRYCLNVPGAILASPALLVPVALIYLGVRLWRPMLAVTLAVGAGIALAAASGAIGPTCCDVAVTWLQWTTPHFDVASLIGLGIPLYLVTMASQNLPGFAVLRQSGYDPPVAAALGTTGLASVLLAPFGAHAITMAAITAALCTGPDCHPDPRQRWRVAIPYFVIYVTLGFFSGTVVDLLHAVPPVLVTAIAGLGLLSPLMSAVPAMVKEKEDVEAALIAFLVTASGIMLLGIGSAFWGLAAGLAFHAARQLRRSAT
ncbi:MAG TPA: benzoate/H(+) symporter BenE family transporter [Aestuariivirgaceae bacterium]|nr:benzoate/H(+) symporter BenE family transporter [Aestuariivirgaceae bacterium]